jgi:uracil phosphoribosyltransferase
MTTQNGATVGAIELDHPLAKQEVSTLRNRDTTPAEFRASLQRLTVMLFLEATRELYLEKYVVTTPLEDTDGYNIRYNIVLVPVLRAGDFMWPAILQFVPEAKIGCIGIRRNEADATPEEYLCKLPTNIERDDVFVLDPMLATGGSASHAIELTKKAGARKIKLLTIIAAPEGVARVNNEHPDVQIYTAALDRCLNDKFYIMPGLGDAGDRLYGTQ